MEHATFSPTFGLNDIMMPFACEMSDVKIPHWGVLSFILSYLNFNFFMGSISAKRIRKILY